MAEQNPKASTENYAGMSNLRSPVLSDRARAKRADDQDQTQKTRANIVERNSPIMVQRVDVTDTGIMPGPLEETGLSGMSSIHSSAKIQPGDNFAPRPTSNDTMQAPRSTLIPQEPEEQPEPLQAVIEKVAKKAKALKPVAEPEVVKPASAQKPTKVQFVGKTFGKITAYCQEVVVSESVIAIGYSTDNASAIVEPPQADIDAEFYVKITDPKTDEVNQYRVLSGEWTFECRGILWVVLVKVSQQDLE